MITIKSKREIELMREAGRIVALAHNVVKEHIKPGISTLELDEIVEKVIRENGAIPSFKNYHGFPASICASINEVVVHGIPSKSQKLKDGDIVSIDIGAEYKGYHGDSAWTYECGNVDDDTKQLLKVTEECLFVGLEQAKPGNHVSDISNAIGEHAYMYGYGVVEEFTGHGIGKNLHEDPVVPNYGPSGKGVILKPGMTIAVEPMINMGTRHVRVLKDKWTTVTTDKKISAHYEHTILITDEGYELLTVL